MSNEDMTWLLRICALIVTFILAWIFVGIRGTGTRLASGQTAGAFKSLFIEKASSSYSLSSLQFYVWMFVGISSYLYYLGGHIFAQNQWSIVDVPDGIVKVMFISISTSVVSSGVSSMAGGKGSGAFNPSPADLISSGGDVAPERIQQLIWTMIAAPVFLILAYKWDPYSTTLDPTSVFGPNGIPDHFLQLMGVSAVGFVGGKIARGPGPKISSLTASAIAGPPPYLVLNVKGSDIQTVGANFALRDISVANQADIAFPATILPSSTIDGSGVATSLDLSIPSAGLRQPAAGTPWKYAFTIFTADGEKAEWQF